MHTITRTLLVTGASSGIGRAIARELLDDGHTVIGISRDVNQFQRQHPKFHPVQLDLNHLDELPQRIGVIYKLFPELDGVIFSAGVGLFGSLEEFSYAQIQLVLTNNFTHAVYVTRALLPIFKSKPRTDLIYIGSEAALKGSRKGTIYCATKFALRGFIQALREECSKDGVRISLINPGMVNTPFFDNLTFAPGEADQNFLLPEDVADAVTYVLNSRQHMVIDEINLNPATRVIRKK
jgi:3-hydroxy acid dehydrogenase / malonic semialdehyde reductase